MFAADELQNIDDEMIYYYEPRLQYINDSSVASHTCTVTILLNNKLNITRVEKQPSNIHFFHL